MKRLIFAWVDGLYLALTFALNVVRMSYSALSRCNKGISPIIGALLMAVLCIAMAGVLVISMTACAHGALDHAIVFKMGP